MASEMLESYVSMIECGADPDTKAMLLGEISSFLLVDSSRVPSSLIRRLQVLSHAAIVEDIGDIGLWRSGVTLAQAIAKSGESSGSAAAMTPPPELVTAIAGKVEEVVATGEKALADGMFEFLRLCSRFAAQHGMRFSGRTPPGDSGGEASRRTAAGLALAEAASSLLAATGRLHMDRVHIEKTLQLANQAARAAGGDTARLLALVRGLGGQAARLILGSGPAESEAACALLATLCAAAASAASTSATGLHAAAGGAEGSLHPGAAIEAAQRMVGEAEMAFEQAAEAGDDMGGSDDEDGDGPAERALMHAQEHLLRLRAAAGGTSGASGRGSPGSVASAEAIEGARRGAEEALRASLELLAAVGGTVAVLLKASLTDAAGSSDTTSRLVAASKSLFAGRHGRGHFLAAASRINLRRAVCLGIVTACGVDPAGTTWHTSRKAAPVAEALRAAREGLHEAPPVRTSAGAPATVHGSTASKRTKELLQLATTLLGGGGADADASPAQGAAAGATASLGALEDAARDRAAEDAAAADAVAVVLAGMDDSARVSLSVTPTQEAAAAVSSSGPTGAVAKDAEASELVAALVTAVCAVPVTSGAFDALTAGLADVLDPPPRPAAAAPGSAKPAAAAAASSSSAATPAAAAEAAAEAAAPTLSLPASVCAVLEASQAPLCATWFAMLSGRQAQDDSLAASLRCLYAFVRASPAGAAEDLCRMGCDTMLRELGRGSHPAVRPDGTFAAATKSRPVVWAWRCLVALEERVTEATPALGPVVAAFVESRSARLLTDSAAAETAASTAAAKGATTPVAARATREALAAVPGFGVVRGQSRGQSAAPRALSKRVSRSLGAFTSAGELRSADAASSFLSSALVQPHREPQPAEELSAAVAKAAAQFETGDSRSVVGFDADEAASAPGALVSAAPGAMVPTPAVLADSLGAPFCSAALVRLASASAEVLAAAEADTAACLDRSAAVDRRTTLARCVRALLGLRRVVEWPSVVTGHEVAASSMPSALACFLCVHPTAGLLAELRASPESALGAVARAAAASRAPRMDWLPADAPVPAGPAPDGAASRLEHAASPSVDALLGARRMHALALAFAGDAGRARRGFLASAPPSTAVDDGLVSELPATSALGSLCLALQQGAGGRKRGIWSHVGHSGTFEQPSQLAHFGKHTTTFELRPLPRSISRALDRARMAGASPSGVRHLDRVLRGLLRTFRVTVPLHASVRHVRDRAVACLARYAAGMVEDVDGAGRALGLVPKGAWEGRGLQPRRLDLAWERAELSASDAAAAVCDDNADASAAAPGPSGLALAPVGAQGAAATMVAVLPAAALAPDERLLQVVGGRGFVVYVVQRPGGVGGRPYVGVHVRSLVSCTARVWLAVRLGDHGALRPGLVFLGLRDAAGTLLGPDPHAPVIHAPPSLPHGLQRQPGADHVHVVRVVVPPGAILRDAVALAPVDDGAAAASAAVQPFNVSLSMTWAWRPCVASDDDLMTWPRSWPSLGPSVRGEHGRGGDSLSGMVPPRRNQPPVLLGKSQLLMQDVRQPGIGRGAYAGTLARSRSGAGDAPPGSDAAVYGDMDPDAEGPRWEGIAVAQPAVAVVVRLTGAAAAIPTRSGSVTAGTVLQPFADGLTSAAVTRDAVARGAVIGKRRAVRASEDGSGFGVPASLDVPAAAGTAAVAATAAAAAAAAADPFPWSVGPESEAPGGIKQVRLRLHEHSPGFGPAADFCLVTVVIADPSVHVPDRPGIILAAVPAGMSTSMLPVDAQELDTHIEAMGSLTSAIRATARKGRKSSGSPAGAGRGRRRRDRDGGGGKAESQRAALRSRLAQIESRMLEAGMELTPPVAVLERELGFVTDDAEAAAAGEAGDSTVGPGRSLSEGDQGGATVRIRSALRPGLGVDEEAALARALGLPLPESDAAALTASAALASTDPDSAPGRGSADGPSSRAVAYRVIVPLDRSCIDVVSVRDLDGRFGAPGTYFVHCHPLRGYMSEMAVPAASSGRRRGQSEGGGRSPVLPGRRSPGSGSGDDGRTAADASPLYPAYVASLPSSVRSQRLSDAALRCARMVFRAMASAPVLPRDVACMASALSGVEAAAGSADEAEAGPSELHQPPPFSPWAEGSAQAPGSEAGAPVSLELDSKAKDGSPSLVLGGDAMPRTTGRSQARAMTSADVVRFANALSGGFIPAGELDLAASSGRTASTFRRFGRTYARACIDACRSRGAPLPSFFRAARAAGEAELARRDEAPGAATADLPGADTPPAGMTDAQVDALVRVVTSLDAHAVDLAAVSALPRNACGLPFRPTLADPVLAESDFLALCLDAAVSNRDVLRRDFGRLGVVPSGAGLVAPFNPAVWPARLDLGSHRPGAAGIFDETHTLRVRHAAGPGAGRPEAGAAAALRGSAATGPRPTAGLAGMFASGGGELGADAFGAGSRYAGGYGAAPVPGHGGGAGDGGPMGLGDMSEEEMLAMAMAASLADSAGTPAPAEEAASPEPAESPGEAATPEAEDSAPGAGGPEAAEATPAAVPGGSDAAEGSPAAAPAEADTGNGAPLTDVEPSETDQGPGEAAGALLPEPAAPPSRRLPRGIAAVVSDLALADACAAEAHIVAALHAQPIIGSSWEALRQRSPAHAAAHLALGGITGVDEMRPPTALSMSSTLEGAELLHVRSEAIANGIASANVSRGAPPRPCSGAGGGSGATAASARAAPWSPSTTGSLPTRLVPSEDAAAAAGPLQAVARRLAAEIGSFEQSPPGGAWAGPDPSAPAARGETPPAWTGVDDGLEVAAARAAAASAAGAARRADAAAAWAGHEPPPEDDGDDDDHGDDDSGDRDGDERHDDESRDLSGGMRQSTRQAHRLERSMQEQASGQAMPREETARELDLFAVRQVLLRTARELSPEADGGPVSAASAACRAAPGMTPAVRRLWQHPRAEDEEELRFLDDAGDAAEPSGLTVTLVSAQLQAQLDAWAAEPAAGGADAAAHRSAIEAAAADAARAAIGSGTAFSRDADVIEALRRVASDALAGTAAATGAAAGPGAEAKALVGVSGAAAALNASTLIRPERLVIGLAQEMRISSRGVGVDLDSGAYALDAFAVALEPAVAAAGAQAGPAPPGDPRVSGVPLSLVFGADAPPAGLAPPDAPPGEAHVGCYVAVDWSPVGVNRWYGGVVRATLQTPDGIRHIVDFDDGDTNAIELTTNPYVVVALPGTFGYVAEESVFAESQAPLPPGALAGSGRRGITRLGRRAPMPSGSAFVRHVIATIVSEARGEPRSRAAHRSAAAATATRAKRVRLLEYDLMGASIERDDLPWATAALGAEAATAASAGTGPMASGPLLLAGPTVAADDDLGAALASSDGEDDVSALDVADLVQAAAGQGGLTRGPVSEAEPAGIAASASTAHAGAAALPDDAFTLSVPLGLLVSADAVMEDARRRLGLQPGATLLGSRLPVTLTVAVHGSASWGAGPPDDRDEAEDAVSAGVLAAGGAGPATAFARAAGCARLGRSLAVNSHTPVAIKPSATGVDAMVHSMGGPGDSCPSRPDQVRSAVDAAAAHPRRVAALVAHIPWMEQAGRDRTVGDSVASLGMAASLASELSAAMMPTYSEGRALVGSLASTVLDQRLLLVPAAVAAFEAQLGDNVAVAFGSLPRWLQAVAVTAPFAIPHSLRRRLFFYSAFGPTRRMLAVQDELGLARPGESEEKAAARSKARDNDPERILPVKVKAVASRSSVLRSARAIFRWWCAPVQRHQRAASLVRRARLLAHVKDAATVPRSAAPAGGASPDARALFSAALPARSQGGSHMAAVLGYGGDMAEILAASQASDTPLGADPGPFATAPELRMPRPPPGCDSLGRRKGALNVSFLDEEAHGAGVTREFYTLVFRQLQLTRTGLWRDTPQEEAQGPTPAAGGDVLATPRYAFAPHGLFPAPLPAGADDAARVLDLFVLAGRAAAKALEDGHRDIDLPIGEPFAKLVLQCPLGLRDVPQVDPGMEATARALEDVARALDEADALDDEALRRWAAEQCDALCLTWTVGDTELVPGGDEVQVTAANARSFCRAVVHRLLVRPAATQARAFRHGFASIADVSALRLLRPSELVSLLTDSHGDGGVWQDHLWAAEAIRGSLTFHSSEQFRFPRDHPTVTAFCEALQALGPRERRLFLEFATASPRLPDNGFAGLRPRRLQVNRRTPRAGRPVDDEPIFCRVCTSELSLPDYSSPEILRARLLESIHSIADGLGGFRKNA